jgi:Bacterial regulatory helix-turn-helix protein, lysR family
MIVSPADDRQMNWTGRSLNRFHRSARCRDRVRDGRHNPAMAARSAAVSPPRLLRAAEPMPAATRLRPALLLSLQAFDAAVRLGSFKDAAEALHITPSAISHRIRNLEKAMGDTLFSRAHRTVEVTPTAAGSRSRRAARSAN